MDLIWKIDKVSVETDPSFERRITIVDWSVTCADCDYVKLGATAFEKPEGSFVPFDEVTHEIIAQWVESKENVELIRQELAANAKSTTRPVVEIFKYE